MVVVVVVMLGMAKGSRLNKVGAACSSFLLLLLRLPVRGAVWGGRGRGSRAAVTVQRREGSKLGRRIDLGVLC